MVMSKKLIALALSIQCALVLDVFAARAATPPIAQRSSSNDKSSKPNVNNNDARHSKPVTPRGPQTVNNDRMSSAVANQKVASAFDSAIRNNGQIQSRSALQVSHNLEKYRVLSTFLPSLSLLHEYRTVRDAKNQDNGNNKQEFRISANWRLFNRFEDISNFRNSSCDAKIEASQALLATEKELLDVIKVMADLRQHIEIRRYLYTLLQNLNELVAIAEKQLQTKLANIHELEEVKMERDRVLLDIKATDATITELKAVYKYKTGLDHNESDTGPVFAIDNNLDAQIQSIMNNQERYLNNNISVRKAYQQYQRSRIKQMSSVTHMLLPTVDLTISKSCDSGDVTGKAFTVKGTSPFTDDHIKKLKNNTEFKLTTTWNLFGGGSDLLAFIQNVKVTGANLDAYTFTRQDVASKLINVYEKYKNTLAFVKHQEKVVELKRQNIKNIEKQRIVGTKSVKDVLGASVKWYEDLKKLAEFRAKLTLLISEIYALAGMVIPQQTERDIQSGNCDDVKNTKHFSNRFQAQR